MMKELVWKALPAKVQNQLDALAEIADLFGEMTNPKVLASLGPAGIKGLLLKQGKQGKPTLARARHSAYFDWSYPSDQPEMRDLFRRAKAGQWDSDRDLAWGTSVDPLNPEVPLLPSNFVDFDALSSYGVHLDAREKVKLNYSLCAWMLSQFLHGEQGALYAAAQVTEAVQFFDGKLYGSTQVMDEGRHVEVFSRYLNDKLERLYHVNDNLFVIIDALMTDARWDMKFLGMQIMVEGLALGAFGTLYRVTKEPLLRDLLRRVIMDEARHVHYGVVALREHIRTELSDAERREREQWAFEIALMMRNRFLAYEVYEEWFEGRISRAAWRDVVTRAPGMCEFRQVMFTRLVPNLREIGLMSPRVVADYDRVGLLQYVKGKSAPELSGEQMLADLDQPVALSFSATA
ncbi:MAG: ferritin-like domain-containing protein [Polyangiaceae bacterium]|nr:ferritin-like domain-containing protein [Polyangiaceae bacterium]